MNKRKGLLNLIFLLCLEQAVLADDKYKAPVPSAPNKESVQIKVGKIATLPYADHISVYPNTGHLIKGTDAYYFTSAVTDRYLFTLITYKEGLVTGELLTLTVGKVIPDGTSVLETAARQYKKEVVLSDGSQVMEWWKDYSLRIVKENLRSDVIGTETTQEAKTWPNDWKKWYNKMVPIITDAAEQRPIVTSEHWALAYKEIWEGIK